MDYRDLSYLGLNEKEAKIYLAAWELCKAPVQKIAENADVNRATAYVIIEALCKRGLMSSYTEGKKQYFCAEAPEKLSLLFREESMAIQRKQEYLDKLLPEFKALRACDISKPAVRYFEGKDGLRSIAEELESDKNEPVRMMYNEDLMNEIFLPEERQKMRNSRIKKRIKTQVIYNSKANVLPSTPDGERLKASFDKYPIFCDLAIFGKNKVRISTLKSKILGLLIENKEIHDSLRSLFDLAILGVKSLEAKHHETKSIKPKKKSRR